MHPSGFPVMKNSLFNTFLVLAFIALSSVSYGQQTDFAALEDSLAKMSIRIWQQKDDQHVKAYSKKFAEQLRQVMELPGSFDYPFDSLKEIGRITSEDKRFRIFTWNCRSSDGKFSYDGLLVTGGEHPAVFPLTDVPGKQNLANADFSTPEHWYGALYYKIIPSKSGKKNIYLLLGWDGIDDNMNSKLIEVLSFAPDGSPVFGMPVFHTPKGVVPRVIIKYAENASLVLRYDYQTLLLPRGKGVKRKSMWMIVTDHLVPMTPQLEGQYEYYVPSGDSYDAYFFNKGKWSFAEGVEVGNPPTGKNASEHKPVNYNLFPPK